MLSGLSEDICQALIQILWNESITGLALVREDGTFWKVNPAFCRITEYTEAELRKMTFQEITHPKDLGATKEMTRLVVEKEYETYDMSKSYLTKTGKVQPVFLRVTGLRINGKFMYFAKAVAPVDRREEQYDDSNIRDVAARAGFFRKIKDNLPVILTVLGGLGILVGYATGLLHLKP